MKNKIINEFKKSDKYNILCIKKLEEYVDFCLSRNQHYSKIGETAHHHILPNKLFSEYSDLNSNEWNGSYLTYADHYYAHWLITESIDAHCQLYAFCAMHYKDFTLGRIKEEDLLSPEKINEKMLKRNKLVTENNIRRSKEGTLFNGYVYCREKSKSKRNKTLNENPHIAERINERHKETINSEEWKQTVGKEKVRKWKENRMNKEGYEEKRVKKFLESFKQVQQTDKYKQNKFKADVSFSKLNNVVIYNKDNEAVYCVPYLFSRFCKENNLPGVALIHSINSKKPLYSKAHLLKRAKLKGYEKYEGWYAVSYTAE